MSSRSAHRARKTWFFAGKLLITGCLLAWIFAKADVRSIGERLQNGRLDLIAAATALIFLNVPLVSLRWWLLLRASAVTRHVPYWLSLRASYLGLFLGQILPGAVGGDVVRAWIAYRQGLRPGVVLASVMVDRLSAVLGLVAMCVLSFGSIIKRGGADLGWSAGLAAGVFLGSTGLALWIAPGILQWVSARVPRLRKAYDLSVMVREGLLATAGATATLISILLHLSTTFAVTLVATSLDIPLSIWDALAVVPLSLLIAAIPISIAGWGLREASMVLGFASFGLVPQDGALLSIWLGVSVLLSAVPGGVFWAVDRTAVSGAPVSRGQ